MPKFLYASAILPGKSELVRQAFRRNQVTASSVRSGSPGGLADAIGLESSQAWLQKTPHRDYFIHGVDTSNFIELFTHFQEQVENRNSEALWLRDFYLTVLGKDFGHHSAAPHILTLLSIDIPGPVQRSAVNSQGYAFPLLPDKLHAFQEFCRQSNGEFLYRFQEACHRFGAIHISYFLQRTPTQNLLVVYEEKSHLSPAQQRSPQTIRAESPACQWLTNTLMSLTGLPFDALTPPLESLTVQPLPIAG